MTANSETILSIQTHPGDDTTQTVTGEKYKGDGFYSRSDGFHTVQYTVTALVGTVKIQATLALSVIWWHLQTHPLRAHMPYTRGVARNAYAPKARKLLASHCVRGACARACKKCVCGCRPI